MTFDREIFFPVTWVGEAHAPSAPPPSPMPMPVPKYKQSTNDKFLLTRTTEIADRKTKHKNVWYLEWQVSGCSGLITVYYTSNRDVNGSTFNEIHH